MSFNRGLGVNLESITENENESSFSSPIKLSMVQTYDQLKGKMKNHGMDVKISSVFLNQQGQLINSEEHQEEVEVVFLDKDEQKSISVE